MREWCRGRGVELLSATALLREHMAAGEQVYFTYEPALDRARPRRGGRMARAHVLGPR